METSVLEKIGLDKNEAKLYLCLLKNGNLSSGEAAKKAKLERSLSYRILERLVDKGLVSYSTENRIKKFKPANPEVILRQLKEKEDCFREALPYLKKLKENEEKSEPEIEIYRGTKGIKNMVRHALVLKKDYCAIAGDFRSPGMSIFFAHFMREIEKENIHERVLVREGEKIAMSKNTEVRYLPKEQMFPSTIGIFSDRVGIMIWSEPFLAITIKSKDTAKTYQSFFDLLWQIAKK